MAFSLRQFRASGVRRSGPVRQRAEQVCYFQIVALTSDVALDFSNYSGTMWAAFLADADYGELGTLAKAAMQTIDDQVACLSSIECEQLLDRVKAAAASGAAYSVAVSSHLPVITCDASNGETRWDITLRWALKDNQEPMVLDLGEDIT